MSKHYHEGNSCLSSRFGSPKTSSQKEHRRNNQSWLKKYSCFFRSRIPHLRGNPLILSRGLAVGVFAGCFPFFGLQSFVGVFLATLFRGSKVAAVAGTWISNPLTYLPIYLFNYKVGKFLLRVDSQPISQLNFQSIAQFKELGSTVAATLIFGCFVVGLIAGLTTYFTSLYLLKLKSKKTYD